MEGPQTTATNYNVYNDIARQIKIKIMDCKPRRIITMAIGLNPEPRIQTGGIQILGFISELDFKSINSGFGISGFEFSFFARFGFSVGFNFRRICKLKIYMTSS